MNRSSLFRGVVGVLVAMVVRLGLAELLSYVFLPVQTWYFHRYIQSWDPDPPFLPLGWMPEIVFPLLGSAIGGMSAALIYRSRSLPLSAVVGLTILIGFLAWWYKAVLLFWETDAVGLLFGAAAFLACYLTQIFLEKRPVVQAINAR